MTAYYGQGVITRITLFRQNWLNTKHDNVGVWGWVWVIMVSAVIRGSHPESVCQRASGHRQWWLLHNDCTELYNVLVSGGRPLRLAIYSGCETGLAPHFLTRLLPSCLQGVCQRRGAWGRRYRRCGAEGRTPTSSPPGRRAAGAHLCPPTCTAVREEEQEQDMNIVVTSTSSYNQLTQANFNSLTSFFIFSL